MTAVRVGHRGLAASLLRQLPGVQALADFLNRNEPIISEGHVAQYHGSGYMLFDPMLPMDIIDRAISELKDHPDMTQNFHHGSRVFNGWQQSEAVRRIALAPRVLRLLQQLYRRKPMPFQTLNFPTGTEQRPHADII